MAIFTVRHDESVNYSIRLVIEFKPIALEEGIRYANAKRYSENKKDFINEVEAFIEGVTFAIPSIMIIDDTQVRNQIINRIIDVLPRVELD